MYRQRTKKEFALFCQALAQAYPAETLQLLLSACASGQNIAQANPFQMAADLKSARESLTNSLANLDIMLGLIEQIENL